MKLEIDVLERLLRQEDNLEDDIVVDCKRFQQIIINLVRNAVKFSQPDGTVVITFATCAVPNISSKVRAIIAVHDEGPCLTEADM